MRNTRKWSMSDWALFLSFSAIVVFLVLPVMQTAIASRSLMPFFNWIGYVLLTSKNFFGVILLAAILSLAVRVFSKSR